MQVDTLPSVEITETLTVSDITVFSSRFSEAIKERIPTVKTVRFLSLPGFKEALTDVSKEEIETIFKRIIASGSSEILSTETVVLFMNCDASEPMVALLSGLDPLVISRMSKQWLDETTDLLHAEFIAIKRSVLDSVTSLYNNNLLAEFLSGNDCSKPFHIVLVELFPSARTPKEVFNYGTVAALSLNAFNRYGFPLFHLGHYVFAYIVPNNDRTFIKKFCMSLITILKRKGFKRVHCGCSGLNEERHSDCKEKPVGIAVIDEAWTALQVACRRGPFAFCDYDLLAHPDHFPLSNLPKSTVSKIRRRWAGAHSFSLVYFIPDYQKLEQLIDIIVRYFGNHNFVIGDKGFWVIRRDVSAEASREWALESMKEITDKNGDGCSLSAGISEYPFYSYSKTEIIKNCQKAILHGDFLGSGSAVVFDAVSLNISGDIYYNEGDLAGAVREYRRGLVLDNQDVNLLNSLGVAYALMNRVKEAQSAFNTVLQYDPANFMALYNKGLGEHSAGRYRKALNCYKRAHDTLGAKNSKNDMYFEDLEYQLGVCYFHVSDFVSAIDTLTTWYENKKDTEGRGKSCRFIGISHYRLSRKKEAMKWLQRSLAFEEQDAEALNILGELYHLDNQGSEIALSLLEKSMELEPRNVIFSLRYARVLNSLGRYDEALVLLRKSARSRKTRTGSWYEMAIAYDGLNKYNKVRYYLKKVIENEDAEQLLKGNARLLLKKITRK